MRIFFSTLPRIKGKLISSGGTVRRNKYSIAELSLMEVGSLSNHSFTPSDDELYASLRTYLHDHAAGAQHAAHLLRALKDSHAATSLGVFAGDLLHQIEEDLATLENLATSIGAGDFQAKELAGWLADKLSRLKLSPLEKPFHTFEALEFISLGILGKRALWRALASIASADPKLEVIDFNYLLERAEVQYTATEAMRLQLARLAFG